MKIVISANLKKIAESLERDQMPKEVQIFYGGENSEI